VVVFLNIKGKLSSYHCSPAKWLSKISY